jgi:hypothetical protein
MGTKSIRHIVESVVKTYLQAETGLAGVNVYSGDSSDVMLLPKAVVLCDSAKTPADLPEGLGNYSCSVRVTLFSSVDDTSLSDHRSRCAALTARMQDLVELKTAFSASADAFCYDVSLMSEDEGVDERNWATVFAFDILAVLPA